MYFETVQAYKIVEFNKCMLIRGLIYTCFCSLRYKLFLTDTLYTEAVHETLVETKEKMIKLLVCLNSVAGT